MASKLARQITQLLLANDALSPLGCKRALEVIDRAIQGKTIFKQVIAKQRHLIWEMYYYIKSSCPTEMLQ